MDKIKQKKEVKLGKNILLILIMLVLFQCSLPTGDDMPLYYEEEYIEVVNIETEESFTLQDWPGKDKIFINDSTILLNGGDRLYKYNLNTKKYKIIDFNEKINDLNISNDKSKIVFTNGEINEGRDKVYIADIDGNNLKCISTDLKYVSKRSPFFSNDDNFVIYYNLRYTLNESDSSLNEGESQIFRVNLNTNEESQIYSGNIREIGKYYNPSDSLLIFISGFFMDYKICKIKLSNNIVENFEENISILCSIHISDKNNSIIYLSEEKSLCKLNYITLEKTTIHDAYMSTSIAMCDDKSTIVFGGVHASNNNDIVVINIDGSNKKIVAQGANPIISPNKKLVVYNKYVREKY